MLDRETKNKIDDLRQILVGKVTDPRSQVEQITNALLYKFMNDMDENSVSLGGVASYFIKEYKKYSWKNLLDKKTSGEDRVNLYSSGIEKMYYNENLPQTFREIFKNSTLPFKEPKVFNKFITRINDFKYSNSESLGDAFEYLLSFMGSQGEAGQFRTPRHIIDFIVEIIDPKKDETIIDPACGTAGFLISSYNHIIKQNTKQVLGDNLNPSDRKKIAKNLNGFDISPEFLKVSLMNMFLHKFNNPRIIEYDTLSSEDKWNEYYDVILANPPFFTPKGGITPHNRFRIKSKRAEVLFIDYIEEHLKPNGRAGVIVPEGVLFKENKSYVELRSNLIKNSLIGIVSLPAGVFEPYSGNKTNILFLDKKKSKNKKEIFFAIIDNDGFELSTNRRPIKKNDLPEIKSKIKNFNNIKSGKKIYTIKKDEILKNSKILFSISEYLKKEVKKNEKKFIKITDVFDVITPKIKIKNSDFKNTGKFPVIDQSKKNISGFWDNKEDCVNCDLPVIIFGDHTKIIKYIDFKFVAGADGTKILKPKDKLINPKFLFFILKTLSIPNLGYSRHFKELKKFKIPLPSLDFQKSIVEELNIHQKIIDGCLQVVENYTPSISIDPNWEKFELNEICDVRDGTHDSPKYIDDGYPLITSKNVINGSISFEKVNLISEKDFNDINKRSKVDIGDILMPMIGTIGRPTIVKIEKKFAIKNVALIKTKNKISQDYIRLILNSNLFNDYINSKKRGGNQKFLSLGLIRQFKVPIPPKDVEKKLVAEINDEEKIILKNKDLISKFQNKIKNKIDNIWSN